MCGALCECLKCPGKVVCCCCKCACNMLLGFICSAVVLIVVIGLIVYFTVFYHKDKGSQGENNAKAVQQLVEQTPDHFRRMFKSLQ